MRDPYLVDEKVGEMTVQIEQTTLSPEDPAAFHDALVDACEATGASRANVASRLAKSLDRSTKLKPARKEYLVNWLADNYVPSAARR